MKTTIITFIVVFMMSVGNTFAKDEPNIYKNVEKDISGKIEKATIYEGEEGTNLNPLKQIVTIFDDNGNVNERIIHTWDHEKEDWQASQKYTYEVNSDGQMKCSDYKTWDIKSRSWKTSK